MEEYIRRVNYYETDKMGFVHHSNYIRWFEEARLAYMDAIGVPYKSLEDMGFMCPVLSAECHYKKSTGFGDTVIIRTRLSEFGNVRYRFSYSVIDADTGELHADGETTHCFIDDKGHAVSLKKKNPDLFVKFSKLTEPDK